MLSLKGLPEKGTYTLIMFVADKLKINVGELGVKTFLNGYYAYTGSALGNGATSLPNRLARHLTPVKAKHWHIDFLIADKKASIEAVIAVSSRQKLECKVNQLIRDKMKAKVSIPKFGASDCENNCGSHLLFFPRVTKCDVLVEKIANSLRLLCGRPLFVWSHGVCGQCVDAGFFKFRGNYSKIPFKRDDG